MFKWLKDFGKKEKSVDKADDFGLKEAKSEGTLAQLRKQSRDVAPRFLVYPFALKIKNGVTIPYTEKVQSIEAYLKKDMMHFEAGIIALAWKGSQESFDVMAGELKNKDYYRRKVVLEYMVYHDMFEKNEKVLALPVLDGHEMIVESALKKVITHKVQGLKEEVTMCMESWPDNKNIQMMCKQILCSYQVDYSDISDKHREEEEKRGIQALIYQGNSQHILQERMDIPRYFNAYLKIIRGYHPGFSEDDARRFIVEMAKEGCGYAVLATTLVEHFVKNQEKFREHFGCELLQNGQYVTDLIMLDFYCMTDVYGLGMTLYQLFARFKLYCDHYKINMNIDVITDEMNQEVFRKYAGNSHIFLYAGDFTMYFKKYKPVHVGGWHDMNVIDVQADGTITVGTWGKEYILTKEDIRKEYNFVYVRYA